MSGRCPADVRPRSRLALDLETLIEIKSSTGRVKDRLVVPLLLAILKGESTR